MVGEEVVRRTVQTFSRSAILNTILDINSFFMAMSSCSVEFIPIYTLEAVASSEGFTVRVFVYTESVDEEVSRNTTKASLEWIPVGATSSRITNSLPEEVVVDAFCTNSLGISIFTN